MKKSFVVLALVAMAALSTASFAATPTYVVTDDDNPTANSATVYTLNSTTGALTQVAPEPTGGTGLGFGFFAVQGSSVAHGATCAFILDNGSNDIAAFHHAGSITKVGNYSNASLSLNGYAGGGMALAPNGKTLYVSYSGSLNIGVWSVASNCALTLAQTFVPSAGADTFGAIAVDPSGKFFVAGSDSFQAADVAKIGSNGQLTDAGSVSFANLSQCSGGCFPAGIDFTKDSKVVLFGNATTATNSMLTASLSSSGLSNPQYWDLSAETAGVTNIETPFLSAAGYAGNGALYLGASGFSTGFPSGEITAKFVESPLSITVTNSTLISNSTSGYQDNIASAGNILITSEVPNLIDTFKINANGSLTPLKVTTDKQANGQFNFVLYPNTR